MNFNLDSILNFAPKTKRIITVVIAVVLYAWNELINAGVLVGQIPDLVYFVVGLFGYNAVVQGAKNDAKTIVAETKPK